MAWKGLEMVLPFLGADIRNKKKIRGHCELTMIMAAQTSSTGHFDIPSQQ